jgi:hypothetical protein
MRQLQSYKPTDMRLLKIFCLIAIIASLSSCYSVRFQVNNGQFEPQDNEREDSYAGYNMHTLDTIVSRQITTGEHYFNISNCPSGALHTIEYKVGIGGVLLNAITLGRKKRVKIKYVCIKENSL